MLKNKFIKYKDIKIRLVFQMFEIYYYALFILKKIFKKKLIFKADEISSILVIRRDMLWDFIISFPSLIKLKLAFPEAKIYFIWTKWVKSLFSIIREDFFDQYYLIDPNFWLPKFIRSKAQYLQKKTWEKDDYEKIFELKDRIDLWIDLRWDLFSLKLLNDLNVKKIISYNICWWSFYIDDKVPYNKDLIEKLHDVDLVDYAISEYWAIKSERKINLSVMIKDWVISDSEPIEQYICIQPGWWRWDYRRWPEGKYIELINKCLSTSPKTNIKLLCADAFEELICKRILSKISDKNQVIITKSEKWQSTIDIINNSILFIGHDTSTAHLCDMLDHSWIILFWPWDRKLFAPKNDNIKIIYHEYDCQPCEQRKCKFPLNSCMNQIGVGEIVEEIKYVYK
ncbi:MAG: hypothetical protein ACD_3C00158G0006 [uncultured bacterium (gcode 4)]|uniref:Uncharacterized protein n=1 Tax=uncultured bacterium (gcode 4) TaxID=1234023 RepID=K2G0R1_9BACT|nr:MAG: hypothetical protein ACD_3C00158G0006 [uncultured bacterium (gcode 4)]